jgi:hypothetical protein
MGKRGEKRIGEPENRGNGERGENGEGENGTMGNRQGSRRFQQQSLEHEDRL